MHEFGSIIEGKQVASDAAVEVGHPYTRRLCSPFGGVKALGLGYKEGVIEAMRSMTYVKTCSLPWDEP